MIHYGSNLEGSLINNDLMIASFDEASRKMFDLLSSLY